ncbi:oligosaccharide flippase family protein [Shewanella metallivivens]|uniref:Oligosaccharide flippase family protein n=1 Tax=Shewanella metallivivens TaxID=2872342 RepID=A0ABT5TG93_9GAMM|nr:oligosaccharide flippase family protein [Shewanella metallivivens]
MKNELLLKSLQVFFVRGFGAAAGFFLTLTVTNIGSTHDAGLFLFCFALISVFATLLTFGAPQALIRIVGANHGNWSVINYQFSIIIKIVFVSCCLLWVLFYFFNREAALFLLNNPLLADLLPLAGLAVLLFAFVQIFASALQGKQYSVLASMVQNVIMPACFIVFLVAIFLLGYEVKAIHFLIIYIASLFVALCVGVCFWLKDSNSYISYQVGFPAELRSSLYPLCIVSVMTLSVQWAGQFATARYLDTSEIAFFASAQRTALLASFVLIAVNLVVAPKFARAFAGGDYSDVNRLSLLSSRLMVVMASPILLFMFIFPDFLMGLFGEQYVIAAPLLQIMAVGQFINVITGSVGYLLTMTNHEKDFRNVVLFSGPLAIILAFVLTKEFGVIGAAYATAIALATQNLLAVAMVKKRLGFNTLNIFRKIV